MRAAEEVGWASFNINIGPLFDNLMCVTPEALREILKAGRSC